MEPNYPGNTNMPAGYPQAPLPEQPKKRWPFSRKLTVIIGVVLALIVLAVVMISLNKGSSSDKNGDNSSLYISRPGYEKEGDGVGDATALISKSSGKIVQYGGINVVQPCAVLKMKDVRDANLKINANSLTGPVTRNSIDDVGAAKLPPPSSSFLPFADESNFCQYYLVDQGVVQLDVYQPPYATEKALASQLERTFTAGADMEGFKIYSKKVDPKDPNQETIFFRSSNLSAQLRIDSPDKAAKEKIIKLTAQRLKQALTTPTPVEDFVFESPILEGKTANPCTFVDNSEFKAALGVDAGPLVEEKIGSSVGVIQDLDTKKLFNYVSHDCKRYAAEDGPLVLNQKYVTLHTITYETEEGAISATKFEQTSGVSPGLEKVTPTIGDESYFGNTAGLQNALVVRKGRV
ncbi:MAG: hypothetical protein ABWX94_02405, partial [Candidatus Saccharimonadales bacterium]